MVGFDEILATSELVLEFVAFVLELVAVGIILFGVVVAVTEFVRRRSGREERGRATLVHDLIFGLDVLVAADIIRTATTPTLRDLGLLAGIVGVRIVLTFVLNREMKELGRRRPGGDGGGPGERPHSPTRSAKSEAAM